MPVSDPDNGFPWTPSQRRAIVLLLSVLLSVLGVRFACHRAFIDDPPPEVPARAAELADRLDPNAADWRELAAIPEVGEKKAHAIVAFRDAWLSKHPGDPPFRGPQDLRLVKGVGPATVSNMTPYLIFPGQPATPQTRP